MQPIKLFWTAGKNNVALNHKKDTKMRDVVCNLREGWYGNFSQFPEGHPLQKKPVNCAKLWAKALNFAGTKYMALCEGLEGTIGDLIVAESAIDDSIQVPIDTLVINLTNNGDEDEQLFEEADM